MKSYLRYVFLLVVVALCFTVALTVSPDSTWTGRGLFALFLLTGSLPLPLPQALAAGVLTIPADLTLVTRGPGAASPNSGDLLVWAAYVAIPLLVVRFFEGVDLSVDLESEGTDEPAPDQSSPESTPNNVEFHPEVKQDTESDPSEQLQELLVKRFREAHDEEERALRRFRLLALGGLVLIYFGLLLIYALLAL